MTLIDAYGHLSLPRFVDVERFLRMMDREGVEKAVISTAETCPNLQELSAAIQRHPDRLRALGLPVGKSGPEIADNIKEQLDSGFIGIRINPNQFAWNPSLLDIFAAAKATPVLVGENRLDEAVPHFVDFLQSNPDLNIVSAHFAGCNDPSILDTPARKALVEQERYHVIFSRHGGYPEPQIEHWAKALWNALGPKRILWGSEYPVCQWRNETFRSTQEWLPSLLEDMSEEDKTAYLSGNAAHLFFGDETKPAKDLSENCQAAAKEVHTDAPVWILPKSTIDLPDPVFNNLHAAYEDAGGDAKYNGIKAFIEAELAERFS